MRTFFALAIECRRLYVAGKLSVGGVHNGGKDSLAKYLRDCRVEAPQMENDFFHSACEKSISNAICRLQPPLARLDEAKSRPAWRTIQISSSSTTNCGPLLISYKSGMNAAAVVRHNFAAQSAPLLWAEMENALHVPKPLQC